MEDKIIYTQNSKKIPSRDYTYYKQGIKYYRNIHPNKFYKRNSDTTFETKTSDEINSALKKIFLSFNLSEFYFSKIIEEYPESSYFEDAKAKLKLLKKIYKSYENIEIEENKIIDNEKFIQEMGLKIL